MVNDQKQTPAPSENDHDALLFAAAEPVLERLRQDRSRVAADSPKIAALLEHFEKNLFDAGLSVTSARRLCQLRDNSIALVFHGTLGVAPGSLIRQCRVEVAKTLLASSLPIWRIALLIGCTSIQVFSRAFQRTVGRRPSQYRRALKRPQARDEKPGEQEIAQRLTLAYRGELPDDEAAALIRHLLDLYPPRAAAPAEQVSPR